MFTNTLHRRVDETVSRSYKPADPASGRRDLQSRPFLQRVFLDPPPGARPRRPDGAGILHGRFRGRQRQQENRRGPEPRAHPHAPDPLHRRHRMARGRPHRGGPPAHPARMRLEVRRQRPQGVQRQRSPGMRGVRLSVLVASRRRREPAPGSSLPQENARAGGDRRFRDAVLPRERRGPRKADRGTGTAMSSSGSPCGSALSTSRDRFLPSSFCRRCSCWSHCSSGSSRPARSCSGKKGSATSAGCSPCGSSERCT